MKKKDLDIVPMPYRDVEVFVQEKYKIAGEKKGSGNTENIGSFKTNRLDYLMNGEGPFSGLGIEVFEDYWSNYPRYKEKKEYTSLEEYFAYEEKKGRDMNELRRIYEYWCQIHEV